MKKKPTKAEYEHMGRVAGLGCIVCRKQGSGWVPAEVHHCKHGMGMGQRASHYDTIPLCAIHHRVGPRGVAYHSGPKTWERIFGRQADLLEQVKALLEMQDGV